jgi:aspartate aminotransferase
MIMMRKVKFVEPVKVYNMIKDEIDAAYFEVMSKGDLIDRGQLKSFEENLAKFVGTKYAVGLNSGYDALHLSLRAAGIVPGDEVIVPAPFFWEFKNYIENYGGIMKLVMSKEDFQLDIDRIERAITKKTKVVLLNSPNNPTGAVYNEKGLKDLAGLLKQKRKEGQEIYIVADDAYRKIVYNGTKLPNLFKLYDLVMAVTSHSKDLALPGERIGYIAISPRIKGYELMVSALMISMRALGFVNAPALFQRAVGKFQRTSVSIDDYQKKRDTLYEILMEAGFECVKPMGAFYMFPKSPVPDELEFVRTLQQEERIMVVPGRGFGKKGYFRIAYCVPLATILKSRDGFIRIGKKFIKR